MFRFKNLFLVGILLAAALMDETCVYAQCTRGSDCTDYFGISYYCCERGLTRRGVCLTNCINQDCDFSSDCAPDECCQSGTCKSGDCLSSDISYSTGLASWIVAVIVISVLLVVAVPVGIVVCCCCCVASAASRPVHRGVVVTGQQNPATSVIAVQNTQTQSSGQAYAAQYPPYANQLQGYPPSGPQGYPPPPQQQKQGYPPPPAYNAQC